MSRKLSKKRYPSGVYAASWGTREIGNGYVIDKLSDWHREHLRRTHVTPERMEIVIGPTEERWDEDALNLFLAPASPSAS